MKQSKGNMKIHRIDNLRKKYHKRKNTSNIKKEKTENNIRVGEENINRTKVK